MTTTQAAATITASKVGEAERCHFLPEFFGPRLMIYGEALVFKWLDRLSVGYQGGLWSFHKLSNGGAYMAPEHRGTLRLHVTSSGFEGELSADAAGIVATLFALGQLAATESEAERDRFVYLFHWLLEYAGEHPEGALIRRAID